MGSEVVILAGGFGSRLASEIGADVPKCMALINGTPIIETQIKLCSDNGFKSILVLVHHLADKVIEFLGDGKKYGVKISYSIESRPRGTAGAIYDALSKLNDTFIVIYGDTFLDVDLREFYKSKLKKDSILTFCHPNSHPFDSDLLEIDMNNKVTRVFRPSSTGEDYYFNNVNAALYVVNKEAFEIVVPDKGQMDISSEMFPRLIEMGRSVRSYKSVEYIKDMGTPSRYKKVCSQVKKGIPSLLSKSSKRRCVFLDRDGVINKEVGHLNSIEKFELLPGVTEGIKILNDEGFLVICVTNQPVIARGDLSDTGLKEIHMKMEANLGKGGAYLDKIYYCPHHPDKGFKNEIAELKIECNCRKPNPGMLLKAIQEYNINPSKSWMIGDHERDIIAGNSVGASTILINKEQKKGSIKGKHDHEFKNLLSACKWIVKNKYAKS